MAKALLSTTEPPSPLYKRRERILIWKKAKGIWQKRKPEPLRELNKMRQEWTRLSR